jgi:hypothetical protein
MGGLEYLMDKRPTETGWQTALQDTQWEALAAQLAGPRTNRLTESEVAQIRQIVSFLLGSDSWIFIRERPSSSGPPTTHIMVESPRVLSEKLVTQAALIDRLRRPLERHRVRVLLIDPQFTLTEEHKRFRFVAREY